MSTASTKTSKTNSMGEDSKALESIISQLNKDYSSIMQMYELDMSIFETDRSTYLATYQEVLSKMSYANEKFKSTLVNKLKNSKITPQTNYLRPLVDPLFEATEPADKITIQGMDIEDNRAAVSVQLFDFHSKTTCCFTELFFDKVDGKWMLDHHDPSAEVRSRWATTVSADQVIGLYERSSNASISYSINKEKDKYFLEAYNEGKTVVGEIKQINKIDVGSFEVIMKNLQGEMIPTYIITGNKMQVNEYNVEKDKWEKNTYIFSQGKG